MRKSVKCLPIPALLRSASPTKGDSPRAASVSPQCEPTEAQPTRLHYNWASYGLESVKQPK